MMKRNLLFEFLPIIGLAGIAALVAPSLMKSPQPFPYPDPSLPRWRGAPVWKPPGELWILQEIIHSVKPDVIIETGSYKGGSAFYLASLLDLEGKGRVVSIDITDWQPKSAHERITYLTGSSTAPAIVSKVQTFVKPGDVVLVDLDSDHSKKHVLAELRAYAQIVSVGSYLIVEDAKTGARPLLPERREEPGEAADQFLSENQSFVRDQSWTDRLEVSYRSEYLRRVR